MARNATKRLKELNRQNAGPSGPRFPSGNPDDEIRVSWFNFILMAVIAFVALTAGAVVFGTRSIEGGLEQAANDAIVASGFDQVTAHADGTEIELRGTYVEGEPIAEAVGAVAGIRGVSAVDANELFSVAPPPDPVEREIVGRRVMVAWSEGSVAITGDVSSSSTRSALIEAVQSTPTVSVVEAEGLVVLEGLPSEAEWIDEVGVLLALALPGIPDGEFYIVPRSGVFGISGETESRQLRKDVNTSAEDLALAFSLDYIPGPSLPDTVVTVEQVEELQDDLDVLIEGKVVEFESDSAELTEIGTALLDEIFIALGLFPNVPVRVEGHASSEGSSQRNLELSVERATAVRDYLVGRGAAENRFTIEGFGDTRPIADNSTEAGRARNRRIEFIAELE